jgi:hypothetical protein
MAYVAEFGETIRTKYERTDSRLRVIYDNALRATYCSALSSALSSATTQRG